MITKMTKYSFILLNGMKDGFLEQLRDLGIVDISRSSKPVDHESQEIASRIDGIKEEIRIIKSSTDAHLTGLLSQKDALMKTLDEITPWGDYDKSKAEALKEAGVPLHFYCINSKKFVDAWKEEYPLEIICTSGKSTHFVIAGPVNGFPEKEQRSPDSTINELKDQIKAKEKEIEKYRKHLEDRLSEIPAHEAKIKDLSDELNLYLAAKAGSSAVEDTVTVFQGFAPSEDDDKLTEAFNAMDVVWIGSPAEAEDNPPIKLKNNKFSSKFEVLTDMYGRPGYDEFDPTPYISIFFLLFFAMCMGDLGYGLILIIVGLLLKKVKSFASLAPLVVYLGIGTVVIGFFFHTFFSVDFSTWNCIPDGLKKIMLPSSIAGFDGTMVLALVVGIVHLLLAMIVKTVYATKNKGFLNSLSTWGWTVFWVGLAIIAVVSLAGVMDKSVTKWAIIILGIICAIGIFPLNNLHRNPLINVGSGLWDTYNMATGILGDVLSYLRLYALGLAGAMLGFAFNDLGKLVLGDGGFGWIPFILLVVIGHSLNLAMAALGAFVHPLRLNFLEFFKNSDYVGAGVNYNPLKK